MHSLCAGGFIARALVWIIAARRLSRHLRRPSSSFLADDIGAKELACYGNAEHATPKLDRLAEGGMRFETRHAALHPTRVMLMSGQYGFHSGYFHMFGSPSLPLGNSPEHAVGDKLTLADSPVLRATLA